MLLWLVDAVNASDRIDMAAQTRLTADVRKAVPWQVMEEAMWESASAEYDARSNINPNEDEDDDN